MDNLKQKTRDEFRWQTAAAGKVIRVTVHYMKTLTESQRGIYVTVQPWEIEDGIESCVLMTHAAALTLPLKWSAPRPLADQAARLDAHVATFAEIYRLEGREACREALKVFVATGAIRRLSDLREPVPCFVDGSE
jgi:hypothetical protein